jgi:DMSO/TMAO reductase YedYZ heme-binding membrane subunit
MSVVTPVLALSGGSASWYLARATGVVTLALLSVSVLLGILTSFRWSSPNWPRFVVEFVHRNVSLLVLVFLAVHVVTVVADGFAPIGWIDVVVPFGSAYRPIWLGLGAVAFDLLVALVVTSLVRHRLGYRTWRLVHWLAYACWPVAVLHGLGTGSDTNSGLVLLVTAVLVVAVLGAAAWRVAAGLRTRGGARAFGLGAIALAPVLLLAWLVSGPLADGWARKAGTPPSAFAAVAPSEAATSPATTPPRSPASSGSFATSGFDATAQGTLHESGPSADGEITLSLTGSLSNGAPGSLDVELTGAPIRDGGVSMRSGTVTLSDGERSYRGPVIGLGESRVVADVSGPDGAPWQVNVDFTALDQQRGTMSATVHAAPRERSRGGEDTEHGDGDDG